MPVNLDIDNVPDELIARLTLRARRHGCSLEAEVLAILKDATRRAEPRLTPAELLEEVRKLALKTPSEAAELVRQMRDERYGMEWVRRRGESGG